MTDTFNTTDTPTISAAELRDLLMTRPDARVLDVRTPGEFESIHIPGSFNVPLDRLGEHLGTVADIEHPIVLVCHSGARAARAQDQINAAGKRNVRVLMGGIESWQKVGGDVARGKEKWAMDRQVRGLAGSIVLASVLASMRWKPARFLAGGVGAGLTYSALSNTCAMGTLLGKLPYNRGGNTDIEAVLADVGAG